jgi:hypothetical protein
VKVALVGAALWAATALRKAVFGGAAADSRPYTAVSCWRQAAHWGNRGSASCAEDLLAGRIWYIGWTVTMAPVGTLTLAQLSLALRAATRDFETSFFGID